MLSIPPEVFAGQITKRVYDPFLPRETAILLFHLLSNLSMFDSTLMPAHMEHKFTQRIVDECQTLFTLPSSSRQRNLKLLQVKQV